MNGKRKKVVVVLLIVYSVLLVVLSVLMFLRFAAQRRALHLILGIVYALLCLVNVRFAAQLRKADFK